MSDQDKEQKEEAEGVYSDFKVDPEIVINFMNEVLEKDPDAIKGLIEHRVGCNEDLMNHDTVQVLCDSNEEGKPINPTVGLLGVLNGLIGKDEETGWGFMAAEFDEDGNLHRFVRTPQTIKKLE